MTESTWKSIVPLSSVISSTHSIISVCHVW